MGDSGKLGSIRSWLVQARRTSLLTDLLVRRRILGSPLQGLAPKTLFSRIQLSSFCRVSSPLSPSNQAGHRSVLLVVVGVLRALEFDLDKEEISRSDGTHAG